MNFEALVKHISTIQNTLQAQAAHAVNLALTSRNWLMGCYIVEFEQNGEDRAAYGEQLLKKLEQRLKTKGLNERRFREFRRLYLVYPQLKEPVTQYIASQIQIRQSLTAEFTEPIRRLVTAESENGVWKLSTEYPQTETWMIPADRLFNRLSSTHLNTISGIENPVKRAFYEMETIRGCWSVKELERQIASLYYERSGLSKNKEALSALVQQQATLLQPKDVINTPVTLEFLGLNDRALVTENDLEQSILDNLQHFLLELLCKPLHKFSNRNSSKWASREFSKSLSEYASFASSPRNSNVNGCRISIRSFPGCFPILSKSSCGFLLMPLRKYRLVAICRRSSFTDQHPLIHSVS